MLFEYTCIDEVNTIVERGTAVQLVPLIVRVCDYISRNSRTLKQQKQKNCSVALAKGASMNGGHSVWEIATLNIERCTASGEL